MQEEPKTVQFNLMHEEHANRYISACLHGISPLLIAEFGCAVKPIVIKDKRYYDYEELYSWVGRLNAWIKNRSIEIENKPTESKITPTKEDVLKWIKLTFPEYRIEKPESKTEIKKEDFYDMHEVNAIVQEYLKKVGGYVMLSTDFRVAPVYIGGSPHWRKRYVQESCELLKESADALVRKGL